MSSYPDGTSDSWQWESMYGGQHPGQANTAPSNFLESDAPPHHHEVGFYGGDGVQTEDYTRETYPPEMVIGDNGMQPGQYQAESSYNEAPSQAEGYQYPLNDSSGTNSAPLDTGIQNAHTRNVPVAESHPHQQGYGNPGHLATTFAQSIFVPPAETPPHSLAAAAPDGTEVTVQCDDCGTILSGVHAVGNLQRHKRSLKCSSVQKREYECPQCGKIYQRSDALLNHSRKRHGTAASHSPQAS